MSDQILKESSVKTFDIHVDALVLNENNTNEMNEATFKRLVQEIKDVGFLDPVDVVPMSDGNYMMLGGEHRYLAAREAGMTYIPCHIQDLAKFQDRDELDLQTFKLNSLRGEVNLGKFFKLYEKSVQRFGPEKVQEAMAVVDQAEWKKLTRSVEKNMRAAGMPEAAIEKVKIEAGKAKNPGHLSRLIASALQEQMGPKAQPLMTFQYAGSDHVVIPATPGLLSALKTLSDRSTESGKSLTQATEEALFDYLKRTGVQS